MKRSAAVLLLGVLPFLAEAADPPGRAARLSLVEGEAAVFVDPEQGWEGARVNLTLTGENSVWTEPRSRAEVRFGAKALRLAETTQLDIVRLDDYVFHGHVARGTLAVRIHDLDRGESFMVTTPDARFELRGNGRYRIDADAARGDSRLTVFSGTARLQTAGGSIAIDTGRALRVSGGDNPRFEFEPAWSTAMDEWALARDQRWEEREALRYVSREMTGWEDLDDHGDWRNEPDYGPVWYPSRVDAGWAPYRYGRWTWVRPWGWTWVDDAPWGYAPFHYGRWVYVGNRWGWYPGRHTARPVWAPALVGWVGGSGWSVSISSGSTSVMGWYPLSPFDSFQPWYTTNVTYVTHVNRIVLPHRRDRDRRDRDGWRYDNRDHGATVVPRNQFGTRRPVHSVMTPVTGQVVAAQPVVPGTAVLPSRNEWRQRVRPGDAAPAPWAPSSDQALQRPASPLTTMTPGKPPIAGAPAVPAQPSTRYPGPSSAPSAPSAPQAVPMPKPNAYTRPAPAVAPAHREKPVAVPAQPAPMAKPVAPRVERPAMPHVEKPVAPRVERPVAPRLEKPVAPRVEKPVAPRMEKPAVPHVEKPSGGGRPSAPSREKPSAPSQEKPGKGN